TREKGTGIGLAVVQKVTEQHNGKLYLEDAPEEFYGQRGACLRMTMVRKDVHPKTTREDDAGAASDVEPMKRIA
ncbi:MAG: hypothetical protein ACR2O4_13860, partial [Hyphomicrobiaceae bacterium]